MVLRSQTPDGVEQEVYGFLLVHYAIRTLMHQAALDAGIDPDRISFTRSLRVARRQVTAQAAFSPSRLARALTRALAEIQRHLLTRRRAATPASSNARCPTGHSNAPSTAAAPQPSQRPTGTITIVAATKPGPTSRKKQPA